MPRQKARGYKVNRWSAGRVSRWVEPTQGYHNSDSAVNASDSPSVTRLSSVVPLCYKTYQDHFKTSWNWPSGDLLIQSALISKSIENFAGFLAAKTKYFSLIVILWQIRELPCATVPELLRACRRSSKLIQSWQFKNSFPKRSLSLSVNSFQFPGISFRRCK